VRYGSVFLGRSPRLHKSPGDVDFLCAALGEQSSRNSESQNPDNWNHHASHRREFVWVQSSQHHHRVLLWCPVELLSRARANLPVILWFRLRCFGKRTIAYRIAAQYLNTLDGNLAVGIVP